MHENHDWSDFLHALADAASAAILPHFRSRMTVESKLSVGFDPVTVADRASETAMRALIEARYPDHGILGEEFESARLDATHVWVLDPIDGTRAFISGLPVWGTLIGLTSADRPVAGMMAQPFTGERYYTKGVSALYRGPDGERRLETRPCASLSEATLFCTTPAMFKGADRAAYDRVETLVRLTRYGCDCYAYCMIAAGHADLVIEADLKPFDILPLVPIIEAAGGVVTGWDGGPPGADGRVVAAGDRRVHAEALARLAG